MEIEPSHAALGTHVNLLKLLSRVAHNSNDETNPGSWLKVFSSSPRSYLQVTQPEHPAPGEDGRKP